MSQPSQPSWAQPRIPGLRIALAGSFAGLHRKEVEHVIQREGGKVVAAGAKADYLAIGQGRASDGKPAASGAKVIGEKELVRLLAPNLENAAAMLRAGQAGLVRWMQLQEIFQGAEHLIDLRGADLRGAMIEQISLQNADLTGADFSKATLGDVHFWDATSARFDGARLRVSFHFARKCSFKNATVDEHLYLSGEDCDFDGLKQDGPCKLDFDDLKRCRLRGAMLRNIDVGRWEHVDATGADLTNFSGDVVKVSDCTFKDAKLVSARLDDASFKRVDFTGARFDDAKIEKSRFDEVTMAGASFRRAALVNCSLRRVDLSRADFRGANLRGSDLTGAQLAGADFAGANLSDVKRTGVDFSRALNMPTERKPFTGPVVKTFSNAVESTPKVEITCVLHLRDGGRVECQFLGGSLRASKVEVKITDAAGEVATDTIDEDSMLKCVRTAAARWAHGSIDPYSIALKSSRRGEASRELLAAVQNALCTAFEVGPPR